MKYRIAGWGYTHACEIDPDLLCHRMRRWEKKLSLYTYLAFS